MDGVHTRLHSSQVPYGVMPTQQFLVVRVSHCSVIFIATVGLSLHLFQCEGKHLLKNQYLT